MSDPQPLPVKFEAGAPSEVPVTLDTAAQKKKDKAALEATYAHLGIKTLKIKSRYLTMLGGHIERLGVKRMGLGCVGVAYDRVEEAIENCDATAKKLEAQQPPCNPELIIAWRTLQKALIEKLIEVGGMFLKADAMAATVHGGNDVRIPFPSGTPMVIAVNSVPEKKEKEKFQTLENAPSEEPPVE